MSDANRDRSTHGGAFVHAPPDSPTPDPGSAADVIRRLLGLEPQQERADPKPERGMNKQVRFLLEMLRMRSGE